LLFFSSKFKEEKRKTFKRRKLEGGILIFRKVGWKLRGLN